MTAHSPQDTADGTGHDPLPGAPDPLPDARDILGQAKGILMERHAIDDAQALDVLEHLSRARDIPVCEAAVLLVRSRRQLPTGLTPPSRDPSDGEAGWPGRDAGLTERESQVLVLASEGLTNAEIGAALFLGRETVKTHLSRAYSKLGVRNRAGAVAFLLRAPDDGPDADAGPSPR